MYRICLRTRPLLRFHLPRNISSSRKPIINSTNTSIENSQTAPPPVPDHRHTLPLIPSQSLYRTSVVSLSAAAVVFASVAFLSSDSDHRGATNPLYAGAEHAARKAADSFDRIFHHAKRTGVAAAVLWQSLCSVLSSANHEVRSGFEIRVAALLADISAANSGRRAAIVGAGGGAVVDWLLESVAVAKDGGGTQAESARALAYLIADPNVSAAVLGRPHAVPSLLRFIFSCQPRRSKNKKQHSRRSAFDISDSLKGRSMLVAAIMDIVTSSCDNAEEVFFKPSLPGNAETRDIAAALQVIEEGGLHLDEPPEGEDDGGGTGRKGIGIKILEGTPVLGLSRTSSDASHEELKHQTPKTLIYQNKYETSLEQKKMSSSVVPGLWDDLHCEHVAVPFATWALANWATASPMNRSHIQELDRDGNAVMSALLAPERSVKWHASLVVRLLLEDRNTPLNESVSDWASSLLSTISQACKHEDVSLAQVAFSAFLLSVERSPGVQKIVMEKGLNPMRDIAKQMTRHKQVQEAMAKALELLCTGELHLSLEESQKWSGILLPWVFGTFSSDTIRSSAIKILSQILEDYGPTSVPLSQGWLAMMLSEVQISIKKSNDKRTSQPKSDKRTSQPKSDNVKTLINSANIASAAQVANQLSSAVVNLAAKQLGIASNSGDASPLADFLSLEPLAGPFKNLKKDNLPKLDATDSALATLKGIKALTEVCAEDSLRQDMIVDFGILCLLRRFLLSDDYEKLAAIEAYDASSRAHEGKERIANVDGEPTISDANDPASVRVPPTPHIRKHAARLLTILSLLPKVKKVITADETWCKWLDDCANGRIPGCSDLKMQSYARAALLNMFCNDQPNGRSESGSGGPSDGGVKNYRNLCPRYDDMIFLINSHLPHWKCPKETDQQEAFSKEISLVTSADTEDETESLNDRNCSISNDSNKSNPDANYPPLDIVFVHGLRGGPYKTWRIAEEKSSTSSHLVEKIDEEAGKLGTFWPGEWLSSDFPEARLFSLKYKTNLTQWSGASLPLQEVSSMLLEKLVAAGIGNRPVVFVTHSMGGLVVKQILHKAKEENFDNLVKNTIGIVFYSCPHFGSKLADMPWRMGFVLRPAPTIGELRSGSSRLIELNDYIRHLHKKGLLDVLSFCETKVTPIVEGYGGWAFRTEIVPIESAYPGFGELVVLESTDHINSCKPVSRLDPSYTETLKLSITATTNRGITTLTHSHSHSPKPKSTLKKRKRYRKLYPGEATGITEEMRFVAMRLHNATVSEQDQSHSDTWHPSIEGFLRYLVDTHLIFATLQRIVDESDNVSYAYMRKTGLERSEGLLKDLEWLEEEGNEIPNPSSPGLTYANYLEELAERSAPLFLSHFYNIYFSHIAAGQVIAKKVSEKLLDGKELELYRWEGDVAELLKGVRDKLNMLSEHWSRDEKNRCLKETTKAFRLPSLMIDA
ncbi:putative inactive heme oxygenase 2, chloroplastic, partial [Mucuna pruriens]